MDLQAEHFDSWPHRRCWSRDLGRSSIPATGDSASLQGRKLRPPGERHKRPAEHSADSAGSIPQLVRRSSSPSFLKAQADYLTRPTGRIDNKVRGVALTNRAGWCARWVMRARVSLPPEPHSLHRPGAPCKTETRLGSRLSHKRLVECYIDAPSSRIGTPVQRDSLPHLGRVSEMYSHLGSLGDSVIYFVGRSLSRSAGVVVMSILDWLYATPCHQHRGRLSLRGRTRQSNERRPIRVGGDPRSKNSIRMSQPGVGQVPIRAKWVSSEVLPQFRCSLVAVSQGLPPVLVFSLCRRKTSP